MLQDNACCAQWPRYFRRGSMTPANWVDVVLEGRWWWLFGTLVLVGLLASGLRFMGLTTDNRVFFGPNNPQLLAFEAFENIYTESNQVLVVFAPEDKNAFSRQTLRAIETFTEQSWRLPFSHRVESLTNFPHSHARGDEVIIEALVEEAERLSAQDLERIRAVALDEPLLTGRLVSKRGHVGAVSINFLLPEENPEQAVKTIAADLRETAVEFETRFPAIEIYLTGDLLLGATVGEATDDDVGLLIPAMFGLIFLIVGTLLRSVAGTVAALLTIVMAVLSAMGLAGWLGYILNPGSAIAPTIILTVAIADSVHIISTLLQAMSRGANKRAAIRESLRVNFFPVFLTSATTVVGFLTLNFSDAPPFNDLGNLVAIGVTAAFVYSVTVLPALLMVLPIKVRARPTTTVLMERLGAFVVARRHWLLAGMTLVFLGLIAGVPRIELNDDWVEYFDQRYSFRTDSDFISDNLSGIEVLEFSLSAGRKQGISDPEYLATLAAFAEWLRAQPKVDNVYALTDIIKRLNKNMHGDDPNYYRLPDNPDLSAQYLLLYELSLPFGQELNDRIDITKSQTRLTAIGDLSSAELRELEARSREWLQENAPDYMVTDPTGMSIMFAHISQRNIDTMVFGSLLALTLISGLLILTLRSVKIGLISLAPNLMPAAMAFGLWGWLYGELGMAVSVVGAMTLGIVVDDTIHFLSKYLRARREQGLDAAAAVCYAFHTVGNALTVTTVALVVGFGVLAFSGFQVNWAMGLLSAVTIAFALITDFFLLPPLLLQFARKSS